MGMAFLGGIGSPMLRKALPQDSDCLSIATFSVIPAFAGMTVERVKPYAEQS
jgi:hypothetical protein